MYSNCALRSGCEPPFLGLAVALQAIPALLEHRPDRPGAYRMPIARQRLRQIHRALAGRSAAATSVRLACSVQSTDPVPAPTLDPFRSIACARRLPCGAAQLQALADVSCAPPAQRVPCRWYARHPGHAAHRAHTTTPEALRRRRGPLPAHALIHQRRKRSIARFDLAKRGRILHILIKGQQTQMFKLFSRDA